MSDDQLALCHQHDTSWETVALVHPTSEHDSDGEAVVATAQEMEAAQRQWEKTQRRHHKPIKRRTHSRPAAPIPSLLPLPAQPSPPPASKTNRASVFAQWLVLHFGERLMRGHSTAAQPTTVADWMRFSAHSLFLYPRLVDESAQSVPLHCAHGDALTSSTLSASSSSSTCSVIDVAGGRGYLSAVLSTIYRVPTTVVDPRPLHLERWRTQYRRRCDHMRQRVEDGRTTPVDVPTADNCHLITHLPTLFPDSLLVHPPHSTSPPPSTPPPPPHSAASSFPTHPSVHPFPSPSSSALLSTRLGAASLIVGLHPDGATEALVDFALRHGKPFAVVPCCVYPDQFRERRLMDGEEETEVRSYDSFVEYLRRKDPRIRVERLPMQGRSAVLFVDPPTTVSYSRPSECVS